MRHVFKKKDVFEEIFFSEELILIIQQWNTFNIGLYLEM